MRTARYKSMENKTLRLESGIVANDMAKILEGQLITIRTKKNRLFYYELVTRLSKAYWRYKSRNEVKALISEYLDTHRIKHSSEESFIDRVENYLGENLMKPSLPKPVFPLDLT